jgi:hypothetical protein
MTGCLPERHGPQPTIDPMTRADDDAERRDEEERRK